MTKQRLAGSLAVVMFTQAVTGCAVGFDYGISGASLFTPRASVDEPAAESAEESASAPLVVPVSFKSTVLAQGNNASCATNADCYEGYTCDKQGASANCEGNCGLCYKQISDEPDEGSSGSSSSSSGSSGGSAPSSSGGGGGGGSPWAWAVLGVLVIVATGFLLAASIKKSKQN